MTKTDPRTSPTGQATPRRIPGALKGRIKIHAGFDELPPNIAAAFGIEPGRSGLANPG